MTALIVFIHGGQHTGHCWQPTQASINQLAQHHGLSLRTLAVNLPGRANQPGDLSKLDIEQATRSVLDQIEAFDSDSQNIILVGHSMAGITLPNVAIGLGTDKVREVVFLACCVPPQGKAVVDTLRPPISWVTALLMKNRHVSKPMPTAVAKWLFTNGANAQQHQIMIDSLCSESNYLPKDTVDRSQFKGFRTRWIVTQKDRSLSPKLQQSFIKNLGGVDRIDSLNTCHNAMITEPEALAHLLLSDLIGA